MKFKGRRGQRGPAFSERGRIITSAAVKDALVQANFRPGIMFESQVAMAKFVTVEPKICEACGSFFARREDEKGEGPSGKRRYCGSDRCLRANPWTREEVERARVPEEER